MNDKPIEKGSKDLPPKRPKLPDGWEQLELPMPNGHTRVITRRIGS